MLTNLLVILVVALLVVFRKQIKSVVTAGKSVIDSKIPVSARIKMAIEAIDGKVESYKEAFHSINAAIETTKRGIQSTENKIAQCAEPGARKDKYEARAVKLKDVMAKLVERSVRISERIKELCTSIEDLNADREYVIGMEKVMAASSVEGSEGVKLSEIESEIFAIEKDLELDDELLGEVSTDVE